MYQHVIMVFLSSMCLLNSVAPAKINQLSNWTPNEDSWNYWWSYSGVSGPAYWGLLNLDWFVCDKGLRQSPINIETRSLVYDPHLTPLRIDNNLINGVLYNDGHAIVFNGSMSLRTMIAIKPETDETASQQVNESKILKRTLANNNNQVLSELNSPNFDSKTDISTNILRDISNSIELSISQSDRLEVSESSLEKSVDDKINYSNDVELESSGDSLIADEQNQSDDESRAKVKLTGAGLIYPFTFEALYLRFSLESASGSEHQINSRSYPAELQLFAYNSLLYKNYAEASTKPHGLLAVSILIDLMPDAQTKSNRKDKTSQQLNGSLDSLLARLSELKHRGSSAVVRGFNLSALIPETNHFVTYDGSLTTPGCHESVSWLLLNKPLYITQLNLDALRSISADEQSTAPTGTLIANNIRPIQPANERLIRTNIKPSNGNENAETCQQLWTKYEYKSVR